ncbi:hypothetical protein [Phyllobacterium leguminum]|uniref:Uncharacterized protein n=1 Tax=Phyllobacterium leguminum TaxID=314237 RepID=A0A318T415_9HYPH|nr:hypothetical protein [Phyllobacterium leguminum]PYE89542.1 hypothetical protein C7477_10349 [Phyllobacterium leguminum]
MSLIHNERIKLLANAFNTAATSSFTVGVLAPIAAAFYNVATTPVRSSTIIIGVGIWLFSAFALHLGARRILGGLVE